MASYINCLVKGRVFGCSSHAKEPGACFRPLVRRSHSKSHRASRHPRTNPRNNAALKNKPATMPLAVSNLG